jgi:hypothetical protein
MKPLFLLFVVIGLLTISASAQSVNTLTEAEVDALAKDAVRNGKGARIFISEYTHTQTIIARSKDKKGNIKEVSDTWEAFIPTQKYRRKASRWVRVKIKENGVPVAADKIEKERIEAGEKLIEAEQEAEKLAAKDGSNRPAENTVPDAKGAYFNLVLRRMFRGTIEFDVRSILEQCLLSQPRRTIWANRPVIALDFKPKANTKWSGAEDYMENLVGTIWIDEADRILVKAEGWPENLSTRPDKLAVYYEAVLVSGGKWLPHRIFINGLAHKQLFGGFNEEVEAILTDYQRYDSEIKDEKIIAPRSPQ